MKTKKLITAFAMATVVLFAGCKKDDFTETSGVCPEIASTNPANSALNVPLDQKITATFNSEMDASTITTMSFIVTGSVVPGTVTYSGLTATFTPTDLLIPNHTYTGRITTTVKNVQGNALQKEYVWTFSTGSTLKPTVMSTDPLNNETNVALNKTIAATFNMKMKANTLNSPAANFTLKESVSGTAVAGVVTYNAGDSIVSFNPTGNLIAGTKYTATISTGVKNTVDSALVSDFVWTFTTGNLVAPTVLSTDPTANEINVALNKTVVATFSEAMDQSTLIGANFSLRQGATVIAGTVTKNATSISFNPTANLSSNLKYTATISTGTKNLAGTALASEKVWSFTTIAAAAPTVTLTDPLNNASGVSLDKTVVATFSEAMDQLTLIGANFSLKQGLTVIAGTVSKTATTISFNPTGSLSSNLEYTATISTGVKNLAGTALASDKVWKFTTRAPLGPGIVNLGTTSSFAAISKAGISTTGVTSITGDIGVSPGAATLITGFTLTPDATNQFSTAPNITGKVYAANFAVPTPAKMTTAISDMENALSTAMGMNISPVTELGAGDISGLTLAPGLYKWSTGLLITGAGVTLNGGPDDTWVFQIAQGFTVNPSAKITLAGGAQAKNIFWVTSVNVILDTNVDFNGNIIAGTNIALKNGAKVTGRLLAETGITLIGSTIIKP